MTRYAAVLLLLLTAGCASAVPDSQVSQPQPAAPQPAAAPVAPTKLPPAPKPAATPVTPATPAAAPRLAAPPVVPAPTAPAAAPLTLDLNELEAQLRTTKAIGVFTKISLKNQVDDLMKLFREHYEGKTTRTMPDLRRSYDLLIMKVLSLLQDTDQMLASAIVSSREAIWGLLSDQNKFANL